MVRLTLLNAVMAVPIPTLSQGYSFGFPRTYDTRPEGPGVLAAHSSKHTVWLRSPAWAKLDKGDTFQ